MNNYYEKLSENDNLRDEKVPELIRFSDDITKYVTGEPGHYRILKEAAISAGYSSELVEFMAGEYENMDIGQGALIHPIEKSKLSAAVKILKKFLKEKWPAIVKKLPSAVTKYLSATFILNLVDAYVGLSDSIEDLLTKILKKLLPSSLHGLIPGIVAVITFALPF